MCVCAYARACAHAHMLMYVNLLDLDSKNKPILLAYHHEFSTNDPFSKI